MGASIMARREVLETVGAFDEAYFTTGSNYGGRYDRFNPPHKIAGYLREIRGFRPPEPYGGKGVRFQGEKVDPVTEEEPGRILHEMRFGSAASARASSILSRAARLASASPRSWARTRT